MTELIPLKVYPFTLKHEKRRRQNLDKKKQSAQIDWKRI